jgi:hypothetical protein
MRHQHARGYELWRGYVAAHPAADGEALCIDSVEVAVMTVTLLTLCMFADRSDVLEGTHADVHDEQGQVRAGSDVS